MKERIKNTIMVNGKRMVCLLFEAEGESGDRFTAVYKAVRYASHGLEYPYLGFNEISFSPNMGIAQHGSSRTPVRGKHLGKRIRFEDLNNDCQKLIIQDLT